MTITAIPPLDRTSATFRTDVDTYFASSIPTFTTEINALATDLTTKQGIASSAAVTATTGAATATTKAAEALGSANIASAGAASAAASAATIGTAAAFSSANAVVKDSADPTKELGFDLSNITSGTRRQVTIPNKSGTLAMRDDTGCVLLATVTPTAVSAIDINVFTAQYDRYEIFLDGINVAGTTNDNIACRFAVGGVVDTSNSYAHQIYGNNQAGSSNALIMAGTSSAFAAASMTISIFNANDSGRAKAGEFISLYRNQGGIGSINNYILYSGLGPLTGIRFFMVGAGIFASQGKIRVYGYNNN